MVLFLLISALAAQSVLAAQPADLIKDIVTLQFMTKLGFKSSLNPFEGIVRFLLLILLFTIFFIGAELLKLGRNASIVIALVFSLISVIFIPGPVLIAAATSYATIVALVLLAIPVLVLLSLYFLLKEHPWIRVAVVGVLLYILYWMKDHITKLSTGAGYTSSPFAAVINTVQGPLNWIIALGWIALAISLIAGIARAGGASEYHPNAVGGLFNRLTQKTKLGAYTGKGKELRHARIEETRLMNDLVVERRELQLLQGAEEKVKKYQQVAITEILSDKEVKSKNHLETFKLTFENVTEAMKAVKDVEHQWKRAERREVAEMRRLIKEMVRNKVSDKDRNEVEAEEKLILNSYIEVNQAVNRVLREIGDVEKFHNNVYQLCEKGYSGGTNLTLPVDLNTLPVALKTLGKIGASLSDILSSLDEAVKAENAAITKTTVLAKMIKDNWVVS